MLLTGKKNPTKVLSSSTYKWESGFRKWANGPAKDNDYKFPYYPDKHPVHSAT